MYLKKLLAETPLFKSKYFARDSPLPNTAFYDVVTTRARVLQSTHFLFDNLKFCVSSFEENKKRSDSCCISVNYGHFYVGV